MIYLEETFDELIQKSYDYSQEKQDNSPAWKVLRSLYQNNYIERSYRADVPSVKIPKRIHQIWLGNASLVEYVKYASTWRRMHPDWDYRIWTDDDVDDVHIPNRKLFNSIKNVAQKSDFLRYHILNQYGGLYVDTDFECVKSFEDLMYLDFFTGVGYPKDVELYIGLIASIPHHPILHHLIKKMTEVRYEGKWRNMFNTTGSYFFTRMFLEAVNENTKGVVAFPPDFFYPFPNNFIRKDPEVDPYLHLTPCSYAIHHWAVSWAKKKML